MASSLPYETNFLSLSPGTSVAPLPFKEAFLQRVGGTMNCAYTLLITDRNRHVRDYLKREFFQEGYVVHEAQDGRELLEVVEKGDAFDLLILDLDIPSLDGPQIWNHLKHRTPSPPVVLHGFSGDPSSRFPFPSAFVEKKEDIEELKVVVKEALRDHDPTGSAGQSWD